MRALILNGAEPDDQAMAKTATSLTEALKAADCTVESIALCEAEIHPCQGDFLCWVKTPGVCTFDDDGLQISKYMMESDLLILLSPVTFGEYSYHLKKALDRLIPNVSPFFTKQKDEYHHQPRYARYPSLAVIGYLPAADDEAEQIFRALARRNAINFMPPAHACSVLHGNLGVDQVRAAVSETLAQVGVIP
ncbi:MAG: flavodoxin family protein [Bacillota bacterium]